MRDKVGSAPRPVERFIVSMTFPPEYSRGLNLLVRTIASMIAMLHSALGAVGLLGLTLLLSENRRAIDAKALVVGLAVMVGLAVALLKLPGAAAAFGVVNGAVDALARATQAGT